MATRSIKLHYKTQTTEEHDRILAYIKNYNNVLRFTYNRLFDANFKLSTKELTSLQQTMNNVFIDSHFKNSAQYEARQFKGKHKVIFGGKYNFIQRCQGKISSEKYKSNRLLPIYSVGEAIQQGNRKFRIQDEHTICFQPTRKDHFILLLPELHKNYKKDLDMLKKLQDDKILPITYKLDMNYIYIIFEDTYIETVSVREKIKDRIFAIDLNPNYIGWSVVDWRDSSDYQIIDSGVISNKVINDIEYKLHEASNSCKRIYISNKRTFENYDTAKQLGQIALHYQCEIFSIEKLEILSQDTKNGKKYNRLVNNMWSRNIFYSVLKKYCDRFNIKFYEVVANYSSFEGNLIYRETGLPDMCLASVELGRRAYEFHHQYILKDKPKEKNIMFDTSEKAHDRIVQSLEELDNSIVFDDIISLYKKLKTRNLKYRVQLEESILTAVFSKKSIKSKVLLYST